MLEEEPYVAFMKGRGVHSGYEGLQVSATPPESELDLQLDGIEFSSVEQDLVDVSVPLPLPSPHLFDIRARPARLPSLISRHPPRAFPAPAPLAPRPQLKALVRGLHSDSAGQGDSNQDVWEPARRFFELRKARLEDLGGAGAWHRWSEGLEFDIYRRLL
ncbi:hypothetical protein EDB84DRAFT_1563883 [Lactarius hengduanensis]|nr:hypothetical protein EDB84DRAFT_1563883 [Lactarius hengduanensis]